MQVQSSCSENFSLSLWSFKQRYEHAHKQMRRAKIQINEMPQIKNAIVGLGYYSPHSLSSQLSSLSTSLNMLTALNPGVWKEERRSCLLQWYAHSVSSKMWASLSRKLGYPMHVLTHKTVGNTANNEGNEKRRKMKICNDMHTDRTYAAQKQCKRRQTDRTREKKEVAPSV